MSDLANRNAKAAQATLERVDGQLGELKIMIVKQNAKIQALTEEVALLKQQQIMSSIQSRQALTGSGGTA